MTDVSSSVITHEHFPDIYRKFHNKIIKMFEVCKVILIVRF